MAELTGRARVFIFSVIVVGFVFFAFVAGGYYFSVQPSSWLLFLFFLVFMVIGDLLPINLPRGGSVAVTSGFYIGAIVLLGTGPAVVLAVAADVLARGRGLLRLPWYRTFFNSAQLALSVGLAGILYQLLQVSYSEILFVVGYGFWLPEFLRLVAAAGVLLGLNCTLVTIALGFAEGLSLRETLDINVGWVLPNLLALAALGLVVGEIYRATGYLGLLLLWGPLLVTRHSFKMYLEMRQLYLDTVRLMARAIEAKDLTTYGHSERVSAYTAAIARKMGWMEKDVERLTYTAILHDTGKLGIPEGILNKPDRLEIGEFERMMRHSDLGADIVAGIEDLKQGERVIRYHHERWDGQGYPAGLKGEEIPLGARIIAVADTFDAITSDRPYRRRATAEEAVAEVKKCSGSQFDPLVVEAFVQAYSYGGLGTDLQVGAGSGFIGGVAWANRVFGAARETAVTGENIGRQG